MNKNLQRLAEPGGRLYLIFLVLFAAAALFFKMYELAVAEGVIILILMIYSFFSRRRRAKQLESYIESVTYDTENAKNNTLMNFPLPIAAFRLDDSRIIWGNEMFFAMSGSSGTRLSGGQAQRLALARTLAHPRPVLVLDDPFSALDRSTEDTVFANLQEYAKDKVVFLISHRLYHFPQMQRVIFMEDGKTTVGTHEELLAAVPAYRQLYESQTGGQQHENEP